MKKRPLFVIGGVLLLTTAVAFFCSGTEDLFLSVACFLTAFLFFLLPLRHKREIGILVLTMALGFGIVGRYQKNKVEIFSPYMGQELEALVFVEEKTSTTTNAYRYQVQATFPQSDLPQTTLIIREYGENSWQVGEKVSCRILLQLPHYETVRDSYRGKGVPCEGILKETLESFPHTRAEQWKETLFSLRITIFDKLQQVLPEESANFVGGMVFGQTEHLPASLYETLNRIGTSHLLSVSGLHLSIFVGLLVLLLEKLKVPPVARHLLGMGGVVFFVALVGVSPPILRSSVMTLLFLLAGCIGRETDGPTSLGVASILICVSRPYWVLSFGLWLSFLSTLGIVLWAIPISQKIQDRIGKGRGKWLSNGLGVTLSAYIFTFPLLVFQTGYLPLLAPFANLIVSPFSTIVVGGGMLLALLPIGFPLMPMLAWLVHHSSRLIIVVSQQLARLPFSIFSLDHELVWLGLLGAVIVAVLLGFILRSKKAIPIVLALSIVFLSLGKSLAFLTEHNQIQLILLEDTECVLLIRDNSCVLVGDPNQYEAERVIRYLHFRNIREIDLWILSQSDGTIQSGLLRMKEAFPLRAVVGPESEATLKEFSHVFPGVPVYRPTYGHWTMLGNVKGEISPAEKTVTFWIGGEKVVITRGKYDIMNLNGETSVIRLSQQEQTLSPHLRPAFLPLGARQYGEIRIRIPVT